MTRCDTCHGIRLNHQNFVTWTLIYRGGVGGEGGGWLAIYSSIKIAINQQCCWWHFGQIDRRTGYDECLNRLNTENQSELKSFRWTLFLLIISNGRQCKYRIVHCSSFALPTTTSDYRKLLCSLEHVACAVSALHRIGWMTTTYDQLK